VAFWGSPVGSFLVRHRLKMFALLFLLLTELCLLLLGKTLAMGPG
jgi:hypothetical protein